MRGESVVRLAFAVVLGLVATFVVGWLLAPAAMCLLPEGADASYTCPNRFGFTISSPLIVAARVVVGLLVTAIVFTSGAAKRDEDG